MPDILLIQPPVRDFYLTAKRTIPYGLACIAASLIREGFSAEILDALATSKSRDTDLPGEMDYLRTYYGKPDLSPFALFHRFRHFGYSFEHIGNQARKSGAFLIGISSLFTAYSSEALETARTVKKFLPSCRIVMGGHHPTNLPEKVMECEAVDFVIRGEGESALPMLAACLKKGESPDRVPGIVFRKSDGSLHVSPPAMMEHPDDWPLPAMHLVKQQFYQRKGRGSTVIVSSRGCPMKCSYCSVGASSLKYRRRNAESVLREIETAVKEYDAGFIDFEDENLSLDRKWFLQLLHGIMEQFGESNPELRAMNGLFPPSLDEELIRTMKKAGFQTLNLSLGSASAEQLRRFRRPDVRDSVEKAIVFAKKYGMEAVCYMIAAAPGQNPEDSVADLLWIFSRNALAGVSVYYPAPGSEDYEKCAQSGLLPSGFSLMRSSALPISHTTSRTDAVTILRLGRIANFIKFLRDKGEKLPIPLTIADKKISPDMGREETGRLLLAYFLHDGKIRGITPDREIYEHENSLSLTHLFLSALLQQSGSISEKSQMGKLAYSGA
ncbi:MAG: radical SAM protein [Desulfococcaceae bacterium]